MSDHHRCPGHAPVTRRHALLGMAAAAVLGKSSVAFAASGGAGPGNKLVVINAMGGLDGLSLVAPYGDPNLMPLRGPIVAPPVGQPGGMLDLGGFYGLHPAMAGFHGMYAAGEALAVHAVGNLNGYRSHFTSQDYLQGGAPELLTSGWLDRAATSFGPSPSGLSPAIMLDAISPLLLRGTFQSAGYAPSPYEVVAPAFAQAVMAMSESDPVLGPALSAGLSNRQWIDGAIQAGPRASRGNNLVTLAAAAGDVLSAQGGPCIAAIATDSFDTHSSQVSRLGTSLAELDAALVALKASLGQAWASTVVLTMTEFGRTAYCNAGADGGTDHGTAFALFVAGGAVSGGKVLGQWPGLAPSQLFQGRDLAPTTDFRDVAATVLAGHMGLSAPAIALAFPGYSPSTVAGLLR